MSHLDQLVSQGKSHFQAKNYEACMAVMKEVLSENPANTEAVWLMKEAQRQWEDQRSLEELEIYVENLKKEAMDLFDQEQFEQCLGMFRFLTELEPGNRTLQDYLKLSQQMFLETLGTAHSSPDTEEKPASGGKTGAGTETVPSRAAALSPLPPAPEPSSAVLRTSREKAGQEDLVGKSETAPPARPLALHEGVSEATRKRIIAEYLASVRPAPRLRRKSLALATSALLLAAALLGVWQWQSRPSRATGRLEIQAAPAASVFINHVLRGRTPLNQEGLPAGTYELRVEEEGYAPYRRRLVLQDGQLASIFVRLERQEPAPEPELPSLANVPAAEPKTKPAPPEPPATLISSISEPEPRRPGEPVALSVIHYHMLGSCTGRLRADDVMVSFRPSGASRDGFTRKTTQLAGVELDGKLTLQFKDKTYRFEALARNDEENRRKLADLYQRIKRRTMQVKP